MPVFSIFHTAVIFSLLFKQSKSKKEYSKSRKEKRDCSAALTISPQAGCLPVCVQHAQADDTLKAETATARASQ